jgi:hypothetical protein
MLTIPPKTHADGPPLDVSRWRLDGRLSNLVAQRFDMDNDEALRFALACGGDLAATLGHGPFDCHLRAVIQRYGLMSLFRNVGYGPHHQAIKPTGMTTRMRSFPKPWHSGVRHTVPCQSRIR